MFLMSKCFVKTLTALCFKRESNTILSVIQAVMLENSLVKKICNFEETLYKFNTQDSISVLLFCRHKAVSSVCRPQTWQEQHPAAQTGHPAHHDHEQDVIHRCQVSDDSSFLNMCSPSNTIAVSDGNILQVFLLFLVESNRPQ